MASFILIGLLKVSSYASKWRRSISFGIFLHCFNLGCYPFHFSPAKNATVHFLWGVSFLYLGRQYLYQETLATRAVPRNWLLCIIVTETFPPKVSPSLWGGLRACEPRLMGDLILWPWSSSCELCHHSEGGWLLANMVRPLLILFQTRNFSINDTWEKDGQSRLLAVHHHYHFAMTARVEEWRLPYLMTFPFVLKHVPYVFL